MIDNRLRYRYKAIIKLMLALLIVMPLLNGCSLGKERYELSEYSGSSIKTFQRRTGEKLVEISNGVYYLVNKLQLMEQNGVINSMTLLKGAEKFSLYGIKIGTLKEEAETKFIELYGTEVSKVINTNQNSAVYTYENKNSELYVSYDINDNTVVELSYYAKKDVKPEEVPDKKLESVNTGELILIVGDVQVFYNEAMVYLKSVQNNYESGYGKGIWAADIFGEGESFGDHIKEEVIKQITELKVINEKAKEENIFLTEEELAEAKAYASEHFEGISDPDIDRYLVTKELLEQVYAENMLAEKMFETKTINVNTEVSDLDAKQVTVQHILIHNTNFDSEGNPVPFTAEEKDKALEKAETLLQKAKEAEDFSELAEANSEAGQIEYTFGRGQGPKEYSDAFEQAAFTLQTGQVSNLVATDYGWHIIYCESAFNVDATRQRKENIIEERRTRMFADLYTEWSADFDVVVNSEAWDSVSFED